MYAHTYAYVTSHWITLQYISIHTLNTIVHYITRHTIPHHTIHHITNPNAIQIQMQSNTHRHKYNQIHISTYFIILLHMSAAQATHLPAGMLLTRRRRVVWLRCAPCSSTKTMQNRDVKCGYFSASVRFTLLHSSQSKFASKHVILQLYCASKRMANKMVCLMHGLCD